jgi:hypothetical protein
VEREEDVEGEGQDEGLLSRCERGRTEPLKSVRYGFLTEQTLSARVGDNSVLKSCTICL